MNKKIRKILQRIGLIKKFNLFVFMKKKFNFLQVGPARRFKVSQWLKVIAMSIVKGQRLFGKILKIKSQKPNPLLRPKAKNLIFGSLITVLLLAGLYFLFFHSSQAMAEWWDTNWHYRKAITITNSGSAQTDFQVKVLSNYDMSTDVTNGKVQADFDDLRFTDINGNALDYWIEDNTAASLDVWVKISSIPTSISTVYLYYGNANASTGKITVGTSSFPGFSCKAILDAGDSSGDGVYYIDPTNGSFSDKFQAYCDMTADGGGWTLITIRREDTSSVESFGSNVGQFFRSSDTIGDVNSLSDNNSYMLGLSKRSALAIEEYLFRQRQNGGNWDTDDAFIIWSTDDLWPDGDYEVPLDLPVIKVCDYNNSNCDTTDVYWKYVSWGHYNSSQCTGDQGGSYYGNYGYCHNGADNLRGAGIPIYSSNSLFGNRTGYSETKLWNYSGGGQAWAEYIYIRGDNYDIGDISSTLQSEEKSPGPVAYWSFDEGYGTATSDRTTNNNDGAISGATWQTEDMCVSGKCLYFDGVNGEINIGSSSTLDVDNEITISFWTKINSFDTAWRNYLIERGGAEAGDGYYIRLWNTGLVQWLIGDGGSGYNGTPCPTGTVLTNKWYHIVGTATSTTMKLYVNGEEIGSKNISGNGLGNGTSLRLAKSSYPIDGFIDEVKIYPYARTPAQIKADYNAGGGATSKGTAVSLGGRSSQGDFLSKGLVGYWKMDEASGISVADASGNGNTGTWYGTGSHYPAGKFGNGGGFNGSDDYVNCGSGASLNITDAITIEAWAKRNGPPYSGTEYRKIVNKGHTGSTTGDYDLGENIFGLYVDNLGYPAGNYTLEFSSPDDVWNHIVAVYDGDWMRVYVNGVDVAHTQIGSHTIDTSNRNLWIGSNNRGNPQPGDWFPGSIDEVRIYNRALSEREVKALYEWAPGPVGHWKMDEKVSGNGQILYDVSGNENNGTTYYGANATGMDCTELGKYGGGCEFDGIDDYVYIGTKTEAPEIFPRAEITIAGWYYLYSVGGAIGHNNAVDCHSSYEIQERSDSRWRFYINVEDLGWLSCRADDIVIAENEWHYVVGTYKHDGYHKIYVDGKLYNTCGPYNKLISDSGSNHTRIGSMSGGGRWFHGLIDDVRIYNYARTQKQILEDMLARRGGGNAGPVGYWKFDEGYGTSAKDSSDQGNNGTIVGADWTNEGKFSKALDFNGSSDYVSNSFGLGILKQSSESEQFTIMAWAKPDGTQPGNERVILGRSGCHGALTAHSSNRFYFQLAATDCWTSGRFLSSGTISNWTDWHHVVGVYNNKSMKIYVDGVLKGSSTLPGTMYNYSDAFYVGGISTYVFDGLIDEAKVFNYALTEEEIKQEYNQGKVSVMGVVGGDGSGSTSSAGTAEYCVPGSSDTCTPPVAEWNFDEKTGDYAYDTSGNGNTGTLTNMEVVDWKSAGECHSGACLDFDGDAEYVNLNAANIVGSSAGTIEAWAYINNWDNLYQVIFASQVAGSWIDLRIILFSHGTEQILFTLSDGTNYLATNGPKASLTPGQWYHLVGTYNGSQVKLYVDGKLADSVDSSITPGTFTSTFTGIGWHSGTRYWNGKIDQVRIYDYARTPAQVAWDYNKGKPVAHWRFDEGQGTTLYDESDNDNDGTLELGVSDQILAGSVKVNANTAWYNGREGKQNYSLNFDGDDDYVSMGDQDKLTGTGYTYAVWIKPDYLAGTEGILDKLDEVSAGKEGITILKVNSDLHVYADTFTTNCNYNNFFTATDTWYYATVIVSSDGCYIYKNAVLVDTGTSNSITDNNVNFYIGQEDYNSRYFDGQIDEVKIFNYALSPLQIKTEYNLGAARLGTGE